MRSAAKLAAKLIPLSFSMAALAEELPLAIQVDRYLIQAELELKDGAYTAAVQTLDRVLAIGREHGLETPTAFWFKHAQASRQAGLNANAIESVLRYLQEAGQGGEHYLAALELLDAIESEAPGPLTVNVDPPNAEIRLIEPRLPYRQSVLLAPGYYRVEVSAFGYRTASRVLQHNPSRGSEHWVALSPWSGGEQFRECADCPEMVVVPAGSFRMGCASRNGCSRQELPLRRVQVPRFALAKRETTFGEWDACLAAGSCWNHQPREKLPGKSQLFSEPSRRGMGKTNDPAFFVNWQDVRSYSDYLSARTGAEYRLPSEAEWE